MVSNSFKGERIITGKRGELRVLAKFLEKGFTVYTPLADIDGIDCILRNDKGRLIEIQIKTRNKRDNGNVHFRMKNFKAHQDFFICCYLVDTDELWVLPSYAFYKYSIAGEEEERILSMNVKNQIELSKYRDDLGLGLLGYKFYTKGKAR